MRVGYKTFCHVLNCTEPGVLVHRDLFFTQCVKPRGGSGVVRAAQLTTACWTKQDSSGIASKHIQEGISVPEHLMIPFLPLGAA